MSGIILMETEQVRSMARQLEQVSMEIEGQASDMLTSIQRLDWLGGSRESFIVDAQKIIRSILTQSGQGIELSKRIDREVMEWESQDQSAEYGTISPSPIIIGVGVVIGGLIISYPFVRKWEEWWWSQTLQGLSTDEAYQRIMGFLDDSPIGRQAIEDARRLGVRFMLAPAGAGTYFDPNPKPGTMYIDPTTQQDASADSFIHELEHAKQTFPDPKTISQDEYIQQCVALEADAKIKEFLYEQQNGLLNFENNPPYEQSYWDAIKDKIAELQKVIPPMSKDAINQMAQEAGRQELIDAYMRGDLTTSTTHQSYVDYYGNGWSQRNQ